MPAIDFETVRTYDEERFSAQEVFRTDRSKVVCGFFEPGQFVPVHAPASDVVISVRRGTGVVREAETEHQVGPGDAVVVEAGTARGIRAADDERLEALLVTAPPPTEAEHDPVRRGIRAGEFEPAGRPSQPSEDPE
ncbi:cupin domain-containing protein [Haloarchaeobius amylolyticus]|uniref:cupin domain-containing protein n=1 Tax=Haloarchaeobius amylolyticus TaxID=1198296 RepID=UPI0022718387|nr:cupin domain-containing protein [Haloarchaeobius amylolyticus]